MYDDVIEPVPRVPSNSPFKVLINMNRLCVMYFDVNVSNVKTLDLETQFDTAIVCPRNNLICRVCLYHLIDERCNTELRTSSTPSPIVCPARLAARALSRFGFVCYGVIFCDAIPRGLRLEPRLTRLGTDCGCGQ